VFLWREMGNGNAGSDRERSLGKVVQRSEEDPLQRGEPHADITRSTRAWNEVVQILVKADMLRA